MRRKFRKGFAYWFILGKQPEKTTKVIILLIGSYIRCNFAYIPLGSLCSSKGIICEFFRNQLLFCLIKKMMPIYVDEI